MTATVADFREIPPVLLDLLRCLTTEQVAELYHLPGNGVIRVLAVGGREYVVVEDRDAARFISPKGKVYAVRRRDSALYCTCPSWVYNRDRATTGCKHTRALMDLERAD
jgi:hypothetical protein